jgi:hypothetical protein
MTRLSYSLSSDPKAWMDPARIVFKIHVFPQLWHFTSENAQ